MTPWIAVRGAGDLATGTIVRLANCGFRVFAMECESPSAIRRQVALSEAVYDGTATVEGVTCRRIAHMSQAETVWRSGEVPLLVDTQAVCITDLAPAVVVDAILAKRNLGTHRDMAPITIALGPGFTAGQDVDAVIETMRGHNLGRVLYTGMALRNTGVPALIGGYGAERVIHAPADGALRCAQDKNGKSIGIGSVVQRGQIIAYVGDTPVAATLDGVLRGLIRTGYPVMTGLKIADIDPRIEQKENCNTISDKARSIAGGVVEAMLWLAKQRGITLS
ncbi:MAG: selenium-dependent molybdenum cofactor biosynthesis protein YqeB [Butyricicoccus pullicaecorum]|nr:EF2563 family selenium-dependent molybdenum hydroxylase system protein [Butyricicoccus pullicaecorum]MDO4669037.1 selenium-dependent molybdenum cofactor biosynthesis protein YqeB [Butyricicoccus pullicaecorum]